MVKTGNQFLFNMIADGSGGLITIWGDDSNSTDVLTKNALFAQKLSASGLKLWGANGVRVSDTDNNVVYGFQSPDGNGGSIICWVENIDDVDSTSNIYAQRLDGNGNRLWGNNGVVVCNSREEQFASSMVSDGSGGVIISWTDERNVDEINGQVFAQRLNSSGVAQWATNGVLFSDNAAIIDGSLIFPDGNGVFTIIWTEDILNGQSEGSRILWQKINVNGVRQTPSNTLLFDFTPALTVTEIITAVPDGTGGFYAAITVDDNVTAKLYLQHVLNNGSKAFNATPLGIEVDPSIGKLTGVPGFTFLNYQVNIESDNSGGVVIAWTATHSGQDGYFAQRYNASGAKMWNTAGITVVPEFVSFLGGLSIVRNLVGDFVFLFSKEQGFGNNLLYVQKLSPEGALRYPSEGAVISNAPGFKLGSLVVSGDKEIIVWSDTRNQTDYDVFAQIVAPSEVLPVRFADFSARYTGMEINLNWTTSFEINNDRFEIERSLDGKQFYKIGTVKGAGTVSMASNYSFSDGDAFSESGYLYYRIKQVDRDNRFDFSEVKSVKVPALGGQKAVSYYPNPVSDKLNVALKKGNGSLSYSVMDISGRLLLNKSENSESSFEIDFAAMPAGTYILHIKAGDRSYKETVIKN